MEQKELECMRHLLTLLQRANLDKPRRKRTFMEVAGVKHREITTSKILAFLLETEAEHGMGDLWLRSLLQAAAMSSDEFDPGSRQISPSQCQTEVVTANVSRDLRIDVVAESPGMVLGIENKIGATLYNDLDSYASQVADMANGRDALLLTLTLHDEAEATAAWRAKCEAHGVALCNVTYAALFNKVEQNVGARLADADVEWTIFARDFMRTIKSQGEKQMQYDPDLFAFVSDNLPEIRLLGGKMEEVTRTTKEQGNRLKELMLADEELSGAGIGEPTVWSPDKYSLDCSTFYHVPIEGKRNWAHPEISNNLSSMQVRAWVNNASSRSVVKSAMVDAGLTIAEEYESHLVMANFPLETPEEDLVEQLKVLVRAILPVVKR